MNIQTPPIAETPTNRLNTASHQNCYIHAQAKTKKYQTHPVWTSRLDALLGALFGAPSGQTPFCTAHFEGSETAFGNSTSPHGELSRATKQKSTTAKKTHVWAIHEVQSKRATNLAIALKRQKAETGAASRFSPCNNTITPMNLLSGRGTPCCIF